MIDLRAQVKGGEGKKVASKVIKYVASGVNHLVVNSEGVRSNVRRKHSIQPIVRQLVGRQALRSQ
jgi:hypothetical protein